MNLFTSIVGGILTMVSTYLLLKRQETHFMLTASYQSMMILSLLYFQFFCTYLTIGLQSRPQFSVYSQFAILSGISCFMGSLSTNKMSVIFFLMQYANHPLIGDTSLRSPRVRFYLISNLTQLLFCIVILLISKYPFYSYYIVPFYLYPLLHIIRAFKLKTKKTFLWYIQLLVWLPSITHPIFIRGYAGNYLRLQPWPSLQYVLLAMILVQVLICSTRYRLVGFKASSEVTFSYLKDGNLVILSTKRPCLP